MILIEFEITEREAAFMSARGRNRAYKAAHAAVGRYWHEHFLKRHFEQDARGRYGYQARTAGYIRRKIREAEHGKVLEGGLVDLVYTGLLREYLSNTGVVHAYPTSVTIRMAGPHYMTVVPFKSGQPDKQKEVKTITREERDELNIVFADAFWKEASGTGEVRTETITADSPGQLSVAGYFHAAA